jgi:allophanate hydrolase subunit 2
VAVHGGIAAPVVLGGRGLLVTAGFGGLFGRPLRAGDRLPVGPGADAITDAIADVGGGAPDAPRGAGPPDVPIRVVPGPDPERFAADAWDRLLAGAWRVAAASDRVGTRLEGTPLRRRDDDAGASAPMVHGAVQVPGGGEPIVLGPDHPTTGGYPVIAVVIAADRGALFARGPGAVVRFEAIDVAAARGARPRWGG